MIYRRNRRRMMTISCRRRMQMKDEKDYKNDLGKDDNDN